MSGCAARPDRPVVATGNVALRTADVDDTWRRPAELWRRNTPAGGER